MKHLKMLGLVAVGAAALLAFAGAGTASATTLTGAGGGVLPAGTTIHAVNEGTVRLTTSYGNIECSKSTVAGKTSNETGASVSGKVETLTFEGCNCTVTVLKRGTLSVTWTSGSNGTVRASGQEVTTTCVTIFGPVHCIYVTNNTDLGTLEGGTTAAIEISNADIPRLPTHALCDEMANLDANYNVDNPDTLNVKS